MEVVKLRQVPQIINYITRVCPQVNFTERRGSGRAVKDMQYSLWIDLAMWAEIVGDTTNTALVIAQSCAMS